MSPALSTQLSSSLLDNDSSPSAALGVNELPDEVLIANVCRGDTESLTYLFRRYARLVRAISLKILKDPSEADDLLQEVFLFVYRKCQAFDISKTSARSWLLQATYHRAIDRLRYLRSRHFYDQVEIQEELGFQPTPSCSADHQAVCNRLEALEAHAAFHSLTENQRLTLELFFFDGYTLEEIAKKLNQTRGNVKNHYFRGLERLRKEIFRKHRKAR